MPGEQDGVVETDAETVQSSAGASAEAGSPTLQGSEGERNGGKTAVEENGNSALHPSSVLGKRVRLPSYAGSQTSTVHALMQACATAFANMSFPIKQMLNNRLLLQPVLESLDSLTEADIGMSLSEGVMPRGERVEIFAGADFSVDIFRIPAGTPLPIVDPQQELGICKIIAGSLSVRYMRKQATTSRRARGMAQAGGSRAKASEQPLNLCVKRQPEHWDAQSNARLLCENNGPSTYVLAVATPPQQKAGDGGGGTGEPSTLNPEL